MFFSDSTPAQERLLIKIRAFLGASFIGISVLAGLPMTALAQSNPISSVDAPDADDKFNAYVKAYNAVNQMFYGSTKGMASLLTKYQSQNLAHRSAGGGREPTRYLNTSMLLNSVDALRYGVAIADVGPYAKVDAAAHAMFANGEPLLRLSREMEAYVSSKKYLEDDFARGREMDGPYIAGWTRFIADHARLGSELDAASRTNQMAVIKRWRLEKEDLRAATAEALLYSSDLIDVFDQPADFRNKDKTAVGDPLAALLEKSAAEIRELTQSGGDHDTRYELISDGMSQFLGYYRSLKSSFFPSQDDFDGLIEQYNRAVKYSNRMH